MGKDAIVGISAGRWKKWNGQCRTGRIIVGVGAIYSTLTKGDAGEPIGTRLLGQIKQRWSRIPMVGIGGIGHGQAAPVVAAGADGVAVVSAIVHSRDPRLAAERLKLEVLGAR